MGRGLGGGPSAEPIGGRSAPLGLLDRAYDEPNEHKQAGQSGEDAYGQVKSRTEVLQLVAEGFEPLRTAIAENKFSQEQPRGQNEYDDDEDTHDASIPVLDRIHESDAT